MAVIAVDPGAPYAMALVSEKGELLAACSFEKVAVWVQNKNNKRGKWVNNAVLGANMLRNWCLRLKWGKVHGVIEMASPRPNEGLVSSCRYVGSMYLMQGLMAGLDIPYEMVAPLKWKHDLGMVGTDKEASRIKALSLWPNKSSLLSQKVDHNKAEAALIALWALNHSKVKRRHHDK